MNEEIHNKDRRNNGYCAHYRQSRSHTCYSRIIKKKCWSNINLCVFIYSVYIMCVFCVYWFGCDGVRVHVRVGLDPSRICCVNLSVYMLVWLWCVCVCVCVYIHVCWFGCDCDVVCLWICWFLWNGVCMCAHVYLWIWWFWMWLCVFVCVCVYVGFVAMIYLYQYT